MTWNFFVLRFTSTWKLLRFLAFKERKTICYGEHNGFIIAPKRPILLIYSFSLCVTKNQQIVHRFSNNWMMVKWKNKFKKSFIWLLVLDGRKWKINNHNLQIVFFFVYFIDHKHKTRYKTTTMWPYLNKIAVQLK